MLPLFAFGRCQGLSEHTVPFDATLLVVEGTVALTVGGKQVQARAGQVALTPADVAHTVRAA